MHQSTSFFAGGILALASLPSCVEQVVSGRETETAAGIKTNYDRHPTFLKLDDEVLLAVTQKGNSLELFKSSSGYGESGGEVFVIGTGAGADMPTASVYVKFYPLEVMALMHNDWHPIYDAVVADGKRFKNAVNPQKVKEIFESITVDPLPQERYPLSVEYRVEYSGVPRWLDEGEYTPVHVGLAGCTLLRVRQRGNELLFFKTSSGYAVAGVKGSIKGTGFGNEETVGDCYMAITPEEAVAHVGGDWHTIYDAALRQARIIPDSVWPSLVRETLCPECPAPPGKLIKLKVENDEVLGPLDDPPAKSNNPEKQKSSAKAESRENSNPVKQPEDSLAAEYNAQLSQEQLQHNARTRAECLQHLDELIAEVRALKALKDEQASIGPTTTIQRRPGL